jgi:DNA-binding response OmpR family regulator
MSTPTVLVVDDEPDVLRLLEVVLGNHGHRVITARTGLEALAAAQEQRPDLVLLDVMMDDMDGWEVLRLLKMDEQTRELPVVMVSARTEPRDKIRGLQEGAVDYLTKPFTMEHVLGTVEAVLRGADS